MIQSNSSTNFQLSISLADNVTDINVLYYIQKSNVTSKRAALEEWHVYNKELGINGTGYLPPFQEKRQKTFPAFFEFGSNKDKQYVS